MLNKTVSNGFSCQEMLSALDTLERMSSTKVEGIKVSFDFYHKIKDNVLDLDFNKKEKFFDLPVTIDENLDKDYEFIYKEDE